MATNVGTKIAITRLTKEIESGILGILTPTLIDKQGFSRSGYLLMSLKFTPCHGNKKFGKKLIQSKNIGTELSYSPLVHQNR